MKNNSMPMANMQGQPDFEKASDVVCEDCGKTKFVVRYFIKRFSPLVSPTGDEMLIPLQVFACASCGHVNDEFLP
jgi:uncharacterized Zn finger protein